MSTSESVLQGAHLIAGTRSSEGLATFHATNPATGERLPTAFHEATGAEIDRAMRLAEVAFETYRRLSGAQIAGFLDAIAAEIEALGDDLLALAQEETGLPPLRLKGERVRMLNGVRMFAAMAREGSWVGARIDHADPQRQPLPKPDVRAMLRPIGPVVVFGASNFPFAISVAGNDTLSALAAGCPVVVKAHPAHPGTSERVGEAIALAAARHKLHPGVFALLQGETNEVGQALVRHPATRAVAFTGSLRGGRALFDAGVARLDPIPVYAEMGSINPVILLPGALAQRAEPVAKAFITSVTLGVGQFCTNPGLVLAIDAPALDTFVAAVEGAAQTVAPATMLHAGIARAFAGGVARLAETPGVEVVATSATHPDPRRTEGQVAIFSTTAAAIEEHPHLTDEVFGPTSTIVRCRTREELEGVVRGLSGHLTASVHGTPEDLAEYAGLIALLETKVGRIIFNGFGTGIEVCAAMHHGGPYPSTTDGHHTSIGPAGIFRFARPVCYQDFPDAALPEALREGNPLGISRLVDSRVTTA
jgi:alpha-ketoglutaric semialdehyde dehydrogenase